MRLGNSEGLEEAQYYSQRERQRQKRRREGVFMEGSKMLRGKDR